MDTSYLAIVVSLLILRKLESFPEVSRLPFQIPDLRWKNLIKIRRSTLIHRKVRLVLKKKPGKDDILNSNQWRSSGRCRLSLLTNCALV